MPMIRLPEALQHQLIIRNIGPVKARWCSRTVHKKSRIATHSKNYTLDILYITSPSTSKLHISYNNITYLITVTLITYAPLILPNVTYTTYFMLSFIRLSFSFYLIFIVITLRNYFLTILLRVQQINFNIVINIHNMYMRDKPELGYSYTVVVVWQEECRH